MSESMTPHAALLKQSLTVSEYERRKLEISVEELMCVIDDLCQQVRDRDSKIASCADALPGTLYMDIPDGGDVSISEQLHRMAKDAARYRWLRSNHPIHDNSPFICRNFGAAFSQWTEEQADAAIDDAMTKTHNAIR